MCTYRFVCMQIIHVYGKMNTHKCKLTINMLQYKDTF